jgi:hypothetical protein
LGERFGAEHIHPDAQLFPPQPRAEGSKPSIGEPRAHSRPSAPRAALYLSS